MTSRRLYSSNNNFYDDFEDFGNLGSNDDSSSNLSSSLQSRVSQVKDAEAAYDAKIARNWRRGNWGVRGFALDKSSETEDPVLVSAVAAPTSSSFTDISLPQDRALPEDRRVAVGRSDGSVFIVKLGEQYLTKFMSVPKLVVEQEGNEGQEEGEDAGMTVRVESEWMDSNDLQNKLQDEPPMLESPMGEEGAVEMMADKQNPFEIVKQFVASEQGEPINVLVFHDVDNGDEGIICTAAGSSGDVYMWTFPPSDKTMQHEMQGTLLSGVHTGEIVSLKTMVLQNNDKEQNVLVSASRDGKFSLWDLDRNGELIFTCHCAEVERDSSVSLTCADVSNPSSDYNYSGDSDNDVIFLGTSDGYVVGYVVQELVALSSNSMPEYPAPNLRFRAHGTDSGRAEAVTAIKCGGDGTIPTSARLRGGADEAGDRNPRMTSSVLLTGKCDSHHHLSVSILSYQTVGISSSYLFSILPHRWRRWFSKTMVGHFMLLDNLVFT